jgi:hypothetical protein
VPRHLRDFIPYVWLSGVSAPGTSHEQMKLAEDSVALAKLIEAFAKFAGENRAARDVAVRLNVFYGFGTADENNCKLAG